jgi:hypothetical protein
MIIQHLLIWPVVLKRWVDADFERVLGFFQKKIKLFFQWSYRKKVAKFISLNTIKQLKLFLIGR